MGRSRTNTLVLAGVALTVLLGVVAFVARGHSAPSGGGAQSRSASQLLANTMFTVWFVAMAVGAVVVMIVMATGRGRMNQRTRRMRRTALGFFVLFVVVLLLLFGHRHLGLFNSGRQNQAGHTHLPNGLGKAEKHREHARKIASPSFEWPVALGIVALLVGVSLTIFLRAKARRSKLAKEVALVRELREVLDETLDDLRAEADPRKAVIAAYARMERILAAHGLPRRPSEAPQEYLERVLVDLRVTKKSVERLTELFARAKFSQHEVDPQMKEDAIDALVDLREQIRIIGETVDKPELVHPPAEPREAAQ